MGSLAGKSRANTYKSLLKVADETNGVTSSYSVIEDGEGTSSSLSVTNNKLRVQPTSANSTSTFDVKTESLRGSMIVSEDWLEMILESNVHSHAVAAEDKLENWNSAWLHSGFLVRLKLASKIYWSIKLVITNVSLSPLG